jgi:hypothetical protein
MNAVKFSVLSLALMFVAAPVRADFTAVMGALKDNTIFENVPNNSGGGAAGIFSGTNNTPSKRRGLIAFNIAGSVPAGATITGVELSMYLANAPNTNNQTIELHRMLFNWGENTADASSPAINGAGNGVAALFGDATWNENFFGTSTWTSLGTTTAPGATNAFSATASGTAVVGGPMDNQQKWLSTSALISDVQGWLNNPATNFGWAIVNANETSIATMKAFYSHQATLSNGGVAGSPAIDPTWLPRLTVTYVPEPAGAVLVVLGGALVLCVRRRQN